jgi:hypothetical protein
MPIEDDLKHLRDHIMKDEQLPTTLRKIPIVTAFRLEYENGTEAEQVAPEVVGESVDHDAPVRCRCKKGCTKRYKCFKNESGCGRRCGCQGLCENKFNNISGD